MVIFVLFLKHLINFLSVYCHILWYSSQYEILILTEEKCNQFTNDFKYTTNSTVFTILLKFFTILDRFIGFKRSFHVHIEAAIKVISVYMFSRY